MIPVVMGLFDPLYWLFGNAMRYLYEWIGNYGLVIIVFTVILRAILIPMFVKSQKGILKQQALQGEVNDIKRVYADDPQTQQQLTMALYKKNGISTGTSCLVSLLQLLIIIPVFTLFQKPLHYVGGVAAENIPKIAELVGIENAKIIARSDIPIINGLKEHGQALGEAVEKGFMELSQLVDLDFLGIDLGMTPTWKPKLLFGADTWRTYLPLLILPVLVMITMFISMRLSRLSLPKGISKEERERENKNPAKAGQTPKDSSAGMMKGMNIMMPIIMLFTMFSLPSAMGLYWLFGNIMGIVQSLIIYYLYAKPFNEHMESAD